MEQTDQFNIVLADSQFLISESLKMLIQNSDQYRFAGSADNLYNLNILLNSTDIDLLITDFNLIDYNGFDNLKKITEDFPQTHILILTNQVTRNELNELARIGIKNLIYKTADPEEIFAAMDSAIRNKKYYSDEVLELLFDNNQLPIDAAEPGYLTPAEIKIVKLITSGLTTKEIAAQINNSFHTVMSHRKNIFRKLNINNSSELVMYAVRAGLTDNIDYQI